MVSIIQSQEKTLYSGQLRGSQIQEANMNCKVEDRSIESSPFLNPENEYETKM